MKKIIVTASAVLFACTLITGCASDELRAEQKSETKALASKQSADRQVERARNTAAGEIVASELAQANLAAKEQQKAEADESLQAIICPADQNE
ncbi:hypothetical protein [Rahnella aceris]|uniref:hypothetical protein n=1 Tax=Rahnella sp. (strain Y9602) TaxID=2703885 RepID=UPI001C27A1A0|nr:hypothetical protein [Rahnella aceris]MBU9866804.1 hypothetical protein [Rahnella aceris]